MQSVGKTVNLEARFPLVTMLTSYNLIQLSTHKWLIQKIAWVENVKC